MAKQGKAPVQTSNYCVLCDDVRVEQSGKLILVGVYAEDIVVGQVPAMLPQLVCVARLEAHWLARPGWHAGLYHSDGTIVSPKITIEDPAGPDALYAFARLGFRNVHLQREGQHVFRITDAKTNEPVFEHWFSVVVATGRHVVSEEGLPAGKNKN